MAMKLLKTQTEDMLLVERLMYTARYSLILERNRCVGCEVCQVVCPREAIEIARPVRAEGEALEHPTITIEENRCHFCGICSAICPFGAFSVKVNGEEVVPVLEKETFPHLVRQIEVEETKCPIDCDECEEACPLGLIKVTQDKAGSRVEVQIDRDHCPCCRLCEVKCPYDAITVRKIILGSIRISNERCPEGCRDCVDVCPVPDALYVSDDGKVSADDFCCVYCGACRVVCPVEEALQLKRSSVHHTPVHSGAWNKALEKLTSTKEMAKELRTKLVMKARESVKRRFE